MSDKVRESGIAFEWVPIDSIKPYEHNARRHPRHQIEDIKNSITKFGFTAPLIVDEKTEILAGHGRYQAATELGLENLPVIRKSNLSAAEIRAYRIVDNELGDKSEWDADLLEYEVRSLVEEEFDMDALGFSDKELSKILEDEPEIKDDELGEDSKKSPRSKSAPNKDEWLVIVTCESEAHQKETFEKFKAEGLECKLMS